MTNENDDKSGGRKKNTRRGNKTSPSMGRLKSISQVSHLNGLSDIHFDDVMDNRKRRNPEAVMTDLAELQLLLPADVSALEARLKDQALTEAFFLGVGDRPDLVATYFFGNAGAGHKSLVDGHPGHAVRMPGPAWEELIMLADDERHEWEDTEGKLRSSPALKAARKAARSAGDPPDTAVPQEMSGQLRKIYGRLPPWVGEAAGRDLDATDLQNAADEIALRFSEETGKRVLGVSIHRESGYDLHVHLIYTDIVEGVREMDPPGKDYAKKLLAAQNKIAEKRLMDRGIADPTLAQKKEERARCWESGEWQNPSKPSEERCYRRIALPPGARNYLRSM